MAVELPEGVTPLDYTGSDFGVSGYSLRWPPPTNWAPYLSAMGGGMQFGASMAGGGATAALQRANAAVAGLEYRTEQQTGAEQAQLYRTRLEQTLGAQSAMIGGANVTASGSALRSLATTAELGAKDIAQIQLNAARRAWGFQVQQVGDLARAEYAKRAGLMGGLGGLITSGARAYGQWQGSEPSLAFALMGG